MIPTLDRLHVAVQTIMGTTALDWIGRIKFISEIIHITFTLIHCKVCLKATVGAEDGGWRTTWSAHFGSLTVLFTLDR